MASADHIPGFAQCASLWTGNVTVTIGAVDATITGSFDSAASIWLALVKKCKLLHGGTWEGWADASGVLQLRHTSTFTMTSSSNTQTRLNLSASASGTQVSGAGAHEGGHYPMSLGMSGFGLQKADGNSTADGSLATPLIWGSASAQVEILDTWANVYAIHQSVMASGDLYTADFWMGGRDFGRFVVESSSTARDGPTTAYTRLNMGLKGVYQ